MKNYFIIVYIGRENLYFCAVKNEAKMVHF